MENKNPQLIDKVLFEILYEQAKGSERKRMFFDMRNSGEDQSQRMLNALLPGTQVAIHKHEKTAETLVCLEGRLDEVFYEVVNGEKLSTDVEANGLCYREVARYPLCPREGKHGIQIPMGMWHSIEVFEPSVIFEAKDGAYGG